MLPMHTSIELAPGSSPPAQKESSFQSSFLAKVPPKQPAGLFAPSEAGDTTDADSSDSDNGLNTNVNGNGNGNPFSVESSADSIGNVIL